ncbi:DUF6600 domain-containing protein [Haloferula sp.]|uniref:DUF6600 domain-containing protein n=1 Tax=Haloferula sp. TaxID=2497595 RepID=UPI00329F8E6D
MKKRYLFPVLAALTFNSCERAAKNDAANREAEQERAAIQAEAEAMEAERAQMQMEREALDAEKMELQRQREAALAEREQELFERESDLALQNEAARMDAEALAAEQAELDRREQELNEVELEQAGTTVIADWTPAEPEVVQEPVADYDLFYDELEPYGDWFETPDYGYVYQPTVIIQNRYWRPYTYGKWVCSNLGWTWRSDEPFGWATFHYGRWAQISGRGWCWVPGSEWAPSWCAWRQGGGHVGWAPLPPETLAYRSRGWGANVDVELGIASGSFTFVESRYMASSLSRHCLPVNRNHHFIKSTRGCTNIQYHRNRIIAGGPSYAALHKAVNKPWPVCHLDLDSTGGFGRDRGSRDHRRGVRQGNSIKVFAPSLNAPWNPGLKPKRVAESWKKVDVVRAESGLQQTWTRRLAEARERQQENARRWAKANEDRRAAQQLQLQRNREKVAEAQARNREKVAQQVRLRQEVIKNSNHRMLGGKVVMSGNETPVPATTPGNGKSHSKGPSKGAAAGRRVEQASLPSGVTRGNDPVRPSAGTASPRNTSKTPSAADKRLAENRRQQEEARERAAQRAEEDRIRAEETRSARSSNPKPTGNVHGGRSGRSGGNVGKASSGSTPTMKDRMEQARQEREKASQEQAARQAQAKAEYQEKLRQQQEKVRANLERAKMEQQKRQQEQQAKIRAAQEKAKRDQAERARQREEQARQKAEADRRAAEQAAREKEAAAQRAAEKRARDQQEAARRQEEARRAAQERARQQQEKAREAAEQRARQQEENQRRMKEAQERIREKIREQQEKNKAR